MHTAHTHTLVCVCVVLYGRLCPRKRAAFLFLFDYKICLPIQLWTKTYAPTLGIEIIQFECTCNHGMHASSLCVFVCVCVLRFFAPFSVFSFFVRDSCSLCACWLAERITNCQYRWASIPTRHKSSNQTNTHTVKRVHTDTGGMGLHAHSNVNKISINWNSKCSSSFSRSVAVSSTKTKGVFYLFKFCF